MSVKRLVPLNAPALAELPTGNRRPGDLVFHNGDQSLYVFGTTNWLEVGTGAGGGGYGGNLDGGSPSSVFSIGQTIDGGTP